MLVAGYIAFFLDLNDFKTPIEQQATQITGRQLNINGDIAWTLYPNIGLNIHDVTLSNPKQFTPKHFVTISNIGLKVALIPLLSKVIQIKGININGMTINWVEGKNGENSLSGLIKDKTQSQQSTKANLSNTQQQVSLQQEPSQKELTQLSIANINVNNIKINAYQYSKLTSSLALDYFSLDQFEFDKNSAFTIQLQAKTNDQNVIVNGKGQFNIPTDLSAVKLMDTKFTATTQSASSTLTHITASLLLNADANLKQKQANLDISQISLNNIQGKGHIAVGYGNTIPSIKANFNFDDIDLTPWLVSNGTSTDKVINKSQTHAEQQSAKSQEPDLSFLHKINAVLTAHINKIQYQKIHSENIHFKASIHKGALTINKLESRFYNGKISLNGELASKQQQVSYQLQSTTSGIDIQPLLKDSVNMDLLSGTASFDLSLNGNNLNPDQIVNNIKGKGAFSIKDGSLYGINIPQQIRVFEAQFKGKQQPVVSNQTDFTHLTGTINIKNGLVENRDLAISAPRLQIDGQGIANLIKQSLDYHLTVNIQDHKDPLKGIEIPFSISGPFNKPQFGIDFDKLLRAKAEKELQRAEKKLENKLKNKLFEKLGLF